MARDISRRDHVVSIYTTTFNGVSDLALPFGEPVDIDGVGVRYFPVYIPGFWKTPFALGRARRRSRVGCSHLPSKV